MDPSAKAAWEGVPGWEGTKAASAAAQQLHSRHQAGRPSAPKQETVPLVAFSHLRWNFVFQRPQHEMIRFGRSRPVLFVEEPVVRFGPPTLEIETVAPGVRVARAGLPIGGTPFGDGQLPFLHKLLRDRLSSDGWSDFVAWLFTPMAVRLAKGLHPHVIIYDCMDQLSAFWGAPPELQERERELLAAADAVMTGGPSLYRAKSDQHSFVRCFPSSVDVEHFSQSTLEPEDQAGIPRPLLGYCGVIDERMDLDVLSTLASTHPEWHIVLIGPVVKIDPKMLPQAENIHYLGQKGYAEIPAYIRAWDVALMPFVLGPATRYISPTKVLEYMACDRPIASTPIVDVIGPYGEIVHLGTGRHGFVEACERALDCADDDRDRRRQAAREVLRRTSWDETVRRMNLIVHYLADPVPSHEVANALIRAYDRRE